MQQGKVGSVNYTGIGSRNIPGEILNFWDENPTSALLRWGKWLGTMGMTLRSGGADGADHAFESGCDMGGGEKEIYIPWKYFNNSTSDLYYIPPEAYDIAGDIYGAKWRFQSQAVKKFMARNMMQVMGIGLDEPSAFLICWTADGCDTRDIRTKDTGGTGQAIAYADEMDIPIFNFGKENGEFDFMDYFLNNADNFNLKNTQY